MTVVAGPLPEIDRLVTADALQGAPADLLGPVTATTAPVAAHTCPPPHPHSRRAP